MIGLLGKNNLIKTCMFLNDIFKNFFEMNGFTYEDRKYISFEE